MKTKRLFLAALFLAILASTGTQTAFSLENQNGSVQDDNTITAVSIVGLKRTKPHTIEMLLQKYIGYAVDDVDIYDVYAIIKDTNILEPLSVEITDSETGYGKTLTVTVYEKWSIFPVPFFSINSDKWNVGAAFIDSNAFGLRDMMLIAGSFGSDSWFASLMYIKTPKAAGGFGFSFMGMFLNQETENTDQTGNDILRRFNRLSINPSFSLSYPITEFINSNLNVSYHYIKLNDSENPLNAPQDGIHAISLSPQLSIRTSSWDGYLLNEKNASLSYTYRFIIGGEDVQSVTLNAAFNHSLIPGFRITAKTGVLFSTTSASPFFESTPNLTVNILSTNYSVLNYAAASVGLEKYLFVFSFGTISVTAAYQVAYSDGIFLRHQFDHGPIATIQMYLSKVALPGIGLGVAYNVDKNFFQYAVNMGMTF
jgi:outer membrane protein assembly factor BamA